MDFISLLSAPVPYLAQKNNDFCKQDNKGFTALHYAVLTMKFDWLNDVLNLNKDNFINILSKNSNKSSILVEHLQTVGQPKKQSHPSKEKQIKEIPFGEEGYTPVHLLIWMMFHYEKETHIDKDSILNKLYDEFNFMYDKNYEILKIKDGNGLSVLEYIILLNQEAILNNKLDKITEQDYIPTLNNATFQQLIEHRDAKNKNIRMNIYNRIVSIQSKTILSEILEKDNSQEHSSDEDNFKI